MRDVSTWDGIKSPCVPFSMRVKVKLQPPQPLFTTTHRATFVKHYGHNKDDLLSNIYCCPYFSKARTSRSLNRQLECISNIQYPILYQWESIVILGSVHLKLNLAKFGDRARALSVLLPFAMPIPLTRKRRMRRVTSNRLSMDWARGV